MNTERETSMSTRAEFGKSLKHHDWYYAYSDDHRVWKAGHAVQSTLSNTHRTLNCPYSLTCLRNWSHNMILEQFAEEEPGKWYRQPRKYKSLAPTKREDLLTQVEHDEITQWMSLGATVEELSSLV